MNNDKNTAKERQALKKKLYEVIFEANTPSGKFFDILLLVIIIISVVTVMLETVKEINSAYHDIFVIIEWVVTILFTIEYVLRILIVAKPWKYITSFYGVIDLLAVLPTYISLILAGSQYLLTIRALRLLRIFRIFKLARYTSESKILITALRASRVKITVFFGAILTLVIIIGSIMYLIEGGVNEVFTSIPRSMYWAIVTVTTVGYGDITPVTTWGQLMSSVLMIIGYSVIAIPTGIVSVELARVKRKSINPVTCHSCGKEDHDADAKYCVRCGSEL